MNRNVGDQEEYEGDMTDGKIEGQGRMKYRNNKSKYKQYIGKLRQGQREGEGTLYL